MLQDYYSDNPGHNLFPGPYNRCSMICYSDATDAQDYSGSTGLLFRFYRIITAIILGIIFSLGLIIAVA